MKKVFFLAMLTLTLTTQVSCQKEILADTETLEILLSEYDYEKLRLIFDDLPEIGFASENYEIANWNGSNKQRLPASQKPLAVYKFSPLLLTEERQEEIAGWKSMQELNLEPFWFIDSNLTSMAYKDFDVINIYLKGELIFNENIGFNALFLSGDKIGHLGTSPLILKSATINEYDLIIKTYPYDHWARQTGIYLDEKIIFNYFPKENTVPLFGANLKIWEGKFLVELSSYAYAQDSTAAAFLVINPKTKETVIKKID